MATLGAFEVVREVHSSPIGSVWEGTSSSGEGVAIVVLGPHEESLATTPTAEDIKAFLDAASIQRTIASASSSWVKVVDIGRTPRGAYAVFEQHRRTLQQLVEVRASVDSADLGVLMRGVVRALRELEEKGTRSHGNIKPARVMLRASSLAEGVLLTLPESGAPAGSVADDLAGLGRIVYRLVMRREFEPLGGWPIDASNEWASLGGGGGGGERIRELCNRFLDPDLVKTRPSLDNVEKELAKIGGGKSRLPLLAGMGALALIGAGVVGFLVLRGAGEGGGGGGEGTPGGFDEESWRRLARSAHVMRTAGLWEATGAPSDLGAKDPSLGEIASATRGLDWFYRLTPSPPQTYLNWIEPTCPAAQKARTQDDPVSSAAREMGAIMDRFANWERRRRLGQLSEAFAARGWDRASAGSAAFGNEFDGVASGMAAFIDTGDGKVDGARARAAIEGVLGALAHAEAAEARWSTIESAAGSVEGAPGAALLRPVAERLMAITRAHKQVELAALGRDLEAPEAFARELAGFVAGDWRDVDTDEFARSAADVATADVKGLSEWIAQARGYLPQTEGAPELATRDAALQTLASDAEAIRAAIVDLKAMEATEQARQYEADLAGLEERSRTLAGIRAVKSNLPRIATESESLARDARAMATAIRRDADARSAAAAAQRWDEMQRLLNTFREPSPALAGADEAAAWSRAVEQALGADPSLAALGQSISDGQKIHASLTEALAGMRRIGSLFPEVVAGDLPEPFVREIERERSSRLAAALASLRVRDRMAEWEAGVRERESEAYQAFEANARALATSLARVERLVSLGYSLDEQDASGETDGATLRSLRAAIANLDAGLDRAPIRAIVARGVEPIDDLAGVASASRTDLATRAGAGDAPLSVDFGVWRALGKASPSWPSSAPELASERAMVERVRDALARAGRAEVFANEIDAEAARRISSFVRSGTKTREDAALASAAASALRVADALSWEARFDIEWAAFLDSNATDPAAIIAGARAVKERMGEPPTDLGPNADRVRALYAAIDASAGLLADAGGARPLDPASVGPGTAGWVGELSPDGSTIQYRREVGGRPMGLEFRLVSEGLETPIFVATTEATVGLYASTLGPVGLSPPEAETETAIPVAWRIDSAGGGRLAAARNWLRPLPAPDASEYLYPEGMRGPTAASVAAPQQEPTLDMPMQFVTPASGLLLARQLGCRFPSPAEWAAALALERGSDALPALLARERANLSDETYQRQDAFVEAQAAAKIPFQSCGPYIGSLSGEDRQTLRDARDAIPGYDDGVLWFRAASGSSGGRLRDLIGNVAELVCERAEEGETLAADPAAIEAFLRARTVSAIGGSALMDVPDLEFGPRAILKPAADRFSDVGFRLVFSAAGALGPSQQAARIIREAVAGFGERLPVGGG